MKEEFKDIAGYEGLYQVSNLGRVKSLKYGKTKKERILTPVNNGKNYYYVCLCKDGIKKRYLIHRLVAQTFLENPNNLPDVNHIDQDKTNNQLNNLEYCDRSYNVRYSQARKVGCYKNGKLIKTYNAGVDTEKDGFNACNVSLCCNGKYIQHKGFQWKYLS